MKTKANVNYAAFNIARAADGKNPFSFRHGLAELEPGAWATFKQWDGLGYRIEKGCKGAPVFSKDAETGKVTCYKVWSFSQVKRTQAARISAEQLAELIAVTAAAGMTKQAQAARKYGELDAEQIAEEYKSIYAEYNAQEPERKRARAEREAQRIQEREQAQNAELEKLAADSNGFLIVDEDAAAGGIFEEV